MTDTILVVEDEVLIRFGMADQLSDDGFKVLEASSVAEALQILQQHPEVALIFTDVLLPGRETGLDLARTVLTHYPHVKIIVTSGHVYPGQLLPEFGALIEKPYSPEKVVEMIRSKLKSGATGS